MRTADPPKKTHSVIPDENLPSRFAITKRFKTTTALTIAALGLFVSTAVWPTIRAQSQEPDPKQAARGVEIAVKAGFAGLAVDNYAGGWVPFRISLTND